MTRFDKSTHYLTETTVFNRLEAIKPQSSRSPLSFLRTSPKFASSTRLEVANEAQKLDNPILDDISAGRLGTNNHEPKVGQRRRDRAWTFRKQLRSPGSHVRTRDFGASSDSGHATRRLSSASSLCAALEVYLHGQNLSPPCARWIYQRYVHAPTQPKRVHRQRPICER